MAILGKKAKLYIYMEKKPNNNLNTTQLQKTEKEVTNFLK